MLLTILASIFVFGILVLVHELGHFIAAKKVGMQVDEFALGFGPKVISEKKGETVYSIRAIPLGGFNDIAGMDASNNPAGDRGFCAKPVFSRMVVILAGASMNFILPVLLLFGIYSLTGIERPSNEPIIGEVIQGMPAKISGFRKGDKILSIDDRKTDTWQDIVEKLGNISLNQEVQIRYMRDEQIGEVTVTPQIDEASGRQAIGIVSSLIHEKISIPEAFSLSVKYTWNMSVMIVESIIQIFREPSQAENLAGPISIVQVSGKAAGEGFIPLLKLTALLSINLGIVNLLPLPALDGGHFVNLLIEAIRGKPLNAITLRYTQQVGIIILLSLTIIVTKNDLVRVFFK